MIVCADDFGLAADINAAILKLCAARRLSAVSCMAVLERCSPRALQPLLEYGGTTDIGLHPCPTDEGLPLAGAGSPRQGSFRRLLWRSLSHALSQRELLSAVSQQYELFVEKTG